MRKEEKDKMNEKKRDDAHKTVMEKIKLKDLKIMVEKTSDPKKMVKILNQFYQGPVESIRTTEEEVKESPNNS